LKRKKTIRVQPKVFESYQPSGQLFLPQQQEEENAEGPVYGMEVQDDSATDVAPKYLTQKNKMKKSKKRYSIALLAKWTHERAGFCYT
jgi:hypothetical protein